MVDAFNPIFQVSEFNEAIGNHLALLGEVTVEGELSRLDIKNGRLIFGTVKDASSSMDIFSMSHLIHNFRQLEPGMKVRITGTAGVYKGTTKFRFFANTITPQGEGALQLAFEKLKRQLESEGLFAIERKRQLPLWPTKIGLITAKDSSAYYDLIKILSARMSGLTIKLLPVNVQGREAVPTIKSALSFINSHPESFDLVILARGGGSLEDLQAFNDESITRLLFSLKVPTVSAIGHEDNWSLTDYVADVRASTPSNAAELAVRDRNEIALEIDTYQQLIYQTIHQQLANIKHVIARSNNIFQNYSHKYHQQIDTSINKITQIIKNKQQYYKQDVANLIHLVDTLNYQNVLKRGFSITTSVAGRIINSAEAVEKNQTIITQLAKGKITSYVK